MACSDAKLPAQAFVVDARLHRDAVRSVPRFGVERPEFDYSVAAETGRIGARWRDR
jgi:hypothetical protein